jgi:hypothetical protein
MVANSLAGGLIGQVESAMAEIDLSRCPAGIAGFPPDRQSIGATLSLLAAKLVVRGGGNELTSALRG